jgi:glycyl-tRNA synthetase
MDDTKMTPVTNESEEEARQDEYDALNAAITKLGSEIRALKKQPTTAAETLASAIEQLQQLKLQAATLQATIQQQQQQSSSNQSWDRKAFDDLMVRKMFIVPSFEIHGGVKGLFDLGPPACAIKVRPFPIRVTHGSVISLTSLIYLL